MIELHKECGMKVLSDEIRENFIGFSHDAIKKYNDDLFQEPYMEDAFYVQYHKSRFLRKPIVVEEVFKFKRETEFKGYDKGTLNKLYTYTMTNRAMEFLAQLKYLSGKNDHKDSLYDFLDKLSNEYSVDSEFGAGVIHTAEQVREFMKEQQNEKG